MQREADNEQERKQKKQNRVLSKAKQSKKKTKTGSKDYRETSGWLRSIGDDDIRTFEEELDMCPGCNKAD